MDENLKRTIILENYQHPTNRGLVNGNSYKIVKTNSESCIDQIDLQLKFENNVIKDVRFDGEACAICTSSTSILINLLIGKTLEEAIDIINNFNNMINEKDYNVDLLGEANVYCDISKQPNRHNCALLSWNGAKKIIEQEKNNH